MNGGGSPDLLKWIHPSLEVRPSAIHGVGLFTTEQLTIGTIVIRFGGYLYSAASRYDFGLVAPDSVVGLSENSILAEPIDGEWDLSDKINHSCRPNLGMLDAITLTTTREIARSSELTCDYAYWEVDPEYVMKRVCNCKASNCRANVTGNDWRRKDLEEQLGRWATPFVKRRIMNLS
jgi:hypothetical protein